MIVVSEIGLMWSPQTEPARTADTEMIIIVVSMWLNIGTTIGTRIEKVPHEVPVEKAIKIAIRKTMTGMSPAPVD